MGLPSCVSLFLKRTVVLHLVPLFTRRASYSLTICLYGDPVSKDIVFGGTRLLEFFFNLFCSKVLLRIAQQEFFRQISLRHTIKGASPVKTWGGVMPACSQSTGRTLRPVPSLLASLLSAVSLETTTPLLESEFP